MIRIFQITTEDDRNWLTANSVKRLIEIHDFTNHAKVDVVELEVGTTGTMPELPPTFNVGINPMSPEQQKALSDFVAGQFERHHRASQFDEMARTGGTVATSGGPEDWGK